MTLELLAERRMAGQRPAGMVFITLVPELRQLYSPAMPVSLTDNFAPLADLSVCIAFHSTQLEQAFHIADKVLLEGPVDLFFWELDSAILTRLIEQGYREPSLATPNQELLQLMRLAQCTS